MRVAYVHDWLVTYRGGEKVLEALLELYPDAPVFTLFYDAKAMPESIRRRTIITPRWLRPFTALRKALLPLLPAAIEALPLEDYDLVISTSSCVAKGVMVGPDTRHLCYIHSPMRYIWDQRQHYFSMKDGFSPKALLIHFLSSKLRIWDSSSNARVDRFLANSSFVAKRVQRYYGRDSRVVHPPVDTARFTQGQPVKGDYFLLAGAFVSYKRFDLAIDACRELGLRLIVAGSGPDEAKLRKRAGKDCEFVHQPSPEDWVKLFQGARAFLFPGIEDFGITAIEAMAAGTPLIAYRGGGALDFVVEGQTGSFFDRLDVDSLKAALQSFDSTRYSVETLRAHAARFSRPAFLAKVREELQQWEGSLG